MWTAPKNPPILPQSFNCRLPRMLYGSAKTLLTLSRLLFVKKRTDLDDIGIIIFLSFHVRFGGSQTDPPYGHFGYFSFSVQVNQKTIDLGKCNVLSPFHVWQCRVTAPFRKPLHPYFHADFACFVCLLNAFS